MSPNESYPQHVVTAVIVAHDGGAWLPSVADAVLGQTRPVQRVVAVDTGSRDRSGSVLGAKFGRSAAFGMERSTGYGAAIARALQHRSANTAVPSAPGAQPADRIEWLWLLHDDSEPAPDCLEQLLRGTVETTSAAVLGPKLRDWSNRDVVLEAGVTLDTATRRVTGIEPREVDQGQHDGDRDVLAVSSAGMLVRRDVWEHVGGFDTGMGLFMEDIDFCWRVHAAGYRVRVITDAIAYHAQAAARHRRPVSVGRRARMLDRRNGLLALLGNLPMRPMLKAAAGNVFVSLIRITFFLLAKQLAAAVDEFSALVSVLCHPIRLITMRGRRARGRKAAYSRVRADLPAGRSTRRVTEFLMAIASRSQPETSGAHHASADPTEDDSMLVDNGLGKRLLTSPSLFTFAALLAVALAASRSLIGSGPLGGGSLVPAWGGSSDVWASYIQTFHPTGMGSSTAAPPWLAVLAVLATLLAGKTWLAIDVLMIGCVPLAGMTAMLAVRKVVTSPAVRVWASVTYALLPVATGIVASGRFGSAVVFILLPLIVSQAMTMITGSGARATRAAWATGLLVAVGAAFVPLLWIVTFIGCVLAAAAFRGTRRGVLRNLAIATLTAPVLLLPWSMTLLSHRADLLLEAGLPQQGTPIFTLPAKSVILLSPGGPGMPPYWITAGLFAAAFAALFAGRRRPLIIAGWGIALSGLLTAAIVSHTAVRPPVGGQVAAWAGVPLALAALGLLLAAAAGTTALGQMLAGVGGVRAVLSGRAPWAALVALVACSTPLLAAIAWLSTGVSGPVHPVTKPVVPELVAVAAGQDRQVRTLVLTSSGGHVSYQLLRGPNPSLADTALTPQADAQRALSNAVSALITPGAGQATDQARLLANLDIGYVLAQAPVSAQLAQALSNVTGLRPYSTTSSYSLWQLNTPPARVTVTEPGGTTVTIKSGPVDVSAPSVPAKGGTLLLAEPAGGWTASLNGHRLTQVPSPAGSWAQAFRLPKGGGTLRIGYPGFTRDLELVVELAALIIVVALALPGIHVAEQEAPAARPEKEADREGEGASQRAVSGDVGESEGGELAGTLSGRRASRAGATAAAGVPQARSQRLARSARNRGSRGRSAARDKANGAGASTASEEPAVFHTRESRPPGTRLADAWPYVGQGDVPAQTRLGDASLDEAPVAEARPDAAEQPSRAARGDLLPESRRSRRSGDAARAGPRHGRPAQQGRAWPYADEPDPDLDARPDFSPTELSGRPYDDGYPESGAGQGIATSGRSPSGRSPSGEWLYLGARDDSAARSATGRDWPDLETPDPGRRRNDEADVSRGTAQPAGEDWGPAPSPRHRERDGQPRGRRGTWRPTRHGSRRAGRADAAAEPSAAWPAGDEALEPLPPVSGDGRRQRGRSAWRPAEHNADWNGRDEEPWGDPLLPAPRSERDGDYEHEYEGDTW